MTSFQDLGIPAELSSTLAGAGITEPTEIQVAVIPGLLSGKDVLAQAPTGSGKTLAFGLPLLLTVAQGTARHPRGLVLAPTRELAEQIKRDLKPAAATVGRTIVAIYGGVPMAPQIKAAKAGVDIVVATPGRLADLIGQGEVLLGQVDRVVVDEADRMADMGFLPSVRELVGLTNPTRQTVLFSATLDDAVAALTADFQHEPASHSVAASEPDMALVSHRFILTNANGKIGLAAQLVGEHGSTMIFCRTRNGVDRVCRQLKAVGVSTGWIHGGRTQKQRDAALMAFTDGRVSALVATDVAARGIHVDDVACVVHFDPPADAKDYVHRSGRTARAGAAGSVVSFVNTDQRKKVRAMQEELQLVVGEFEERAILDAAVAGPTHQTKPAAAPEVRVAAPETKPEQKPKGKARSSRSGKPRPKNKASRSKAGNARAVTGNAETAPKAKRRRPPKKRALKNKGKRRGSSR